MAGKPTDDIVRCSFCNKTQAQVGAAYRNKEWERKNLTYRNKEQE